jgi:hypothetical protein
VAVAHSQGANNRIQAARADLAGGAAGAEPAPEAPGNEGDHGHDHETTNHNAPDIQRPDNPDVTAPNGHADALNSQNLGRDDEGLVDDYNDFLDIPPRVDWDGPLPDEMPFSELPSFLPGGRRGRQPTFPLNALSPQPPVDPWRTPFEVPAPVVEPWFPDSIEVNCDVPETLSIEWSEPFSPPPVAWDPPSEPALIEGIP